MRKYKIIAIDSGLLLGELLETLIINGIKEHVVQIGSKRFFIKQEKCLIMRK